MNQDDEMRLHAYLDGELGSTDAVEFERRLADRPDLAAGLQELRAMRERIRRQATWHEAPATLQRRIGRALSGAARSERPAGRAFGGISLPGWLRWTLVPPLAAGALAGALLVLALTSLQPRPGPDALTDELVDDHLRSMLGARWVDVASSDKHTVKPWVSEHLGFSPAVPDLSEQGYELVGGRLEVVATRPTAVLVYRRRLHVISVFVWPDGSTQESAEPGSERERRGYRVVRWHRNGMAYRAISDLNAGELGDFSRLLSSAQ